MDRKNVLCQVCLSIHLTPSHFSFAYYLFFCLFFLHNLPFPFDLSLFFFYPFHSFLYVLAFPLPLLSLSPLPSSSSPHFLLIFLPTKSGLQDWRGRVCRHFRGRQSRGRRAARSLGVVTPDVPSVPTISRKCEPCCAPGTKLLQLGVPRTPEGGEVRPRSLTRRGSKSGLCIYLGLQIPFAASKR